MLILARFSGVVVVMIGTVIAVNPKVFLAILNFWKQGKNIYLAGVLRLVFGSIFLSIASACRLPKVVSVLGVLMLIGALLIFVLGPKRMQIIFGWWEKRPPLALRLMGLVALAIGAVIIYSV